MDGSQAVRLVLLHGEPAEMTALQEVLESAPGFFELVDGGPPGPAEALSTYTVLPEGVTYEDKSVYGVYLGDLMVGCVDLIRGYPDAHSAMLGLFLIGEPWQGRGIGSAAYRETEGVVRGWADAERVRIGVVRANVPAFGFWHAMGFTETGDVRPYESGPVTSEVVVMEKPLA